MRTFPIFLAACLHLAVAMSACGQDSASPSDPIALPRVYVYRYKSVYGLGMSPSFFCDGKNVARIQNGRMLVLALPPGKHSFASEDKPAVELELKSGQQYYIRLGLVPRPWQKTLGHIDLVLPEQGISEVKQAVPAEKKMIKDPSFLAGEFVPKK